jgi:hypothetical protein
VPWNGRADEAERLRDAFAGHVDEQASVKARVDYFATSLPEMLLFDQDVQEVHDRHIKVLRARLESLDEADPANAARPPLLEGER